MIEYGIVDDFLPENELDIIVDTFLGEKSVGVFPLFLKDGVSYTRHTSPDKYTGDGIYFTHTFVADGNFNSPYLDFLEPIILKLPNFTRLIRAEFNLYPSSTPRKKHGWHTDQNYMHTGCLFYLNTNNGPTEIREKDGSSSISIKAVKNRALFFDPSFDHRSSTCSDKDYRATLIFNYL